MRHLALGWCALIAAVVACGASLCWGAAGAGAVPVALRGFEAESMVGVTRVLGVASASGGEVVPLRPRRALVRRVDVLRSRRVEVTLGRGCRRGLEVDVALDDRPIGRVVPRARSLHVWGANVKVRSGWHRVALRAVAAAGRALPACAWPLVDRVDFVPASPSDGVLLGAAMRAVNLASDASYRSVFLRNFDSLTPENELKMAYVEPSPGVFDFGPADELIDFAHAAGDQVRGHTLVYGSQLPSWVTNPIVPWTPSTLLRVMQTYITTVMHRYASEVNTWDVVNEAFNDDGSYRQNVWYDVIGPGYIADAFRFARAADPKAELFYNDLGGEEPGPKADAILAMVRGFQQAGVPIDGIGLQDHTDVPGFPPQSVLQSMIATYARLGLRVEITELDIGTLDAPGTTVEKERAQAIAYRAQAAACWDIAACHRLTTWGEYDGLTWLGSEEAPLLFDQQYQPKPALFAVDRALHRTVLSGGPG